MNKILSLFLGLALALCPALALAQTFGSPNLVISAYKYSHISTQTTTVVKSVPGILHSICYGTAGAGAIATVYDNTSATGTVLSTITLSNADAPQCLIFDLAFATGLTVVTTVANSDLTVTYF